MVAVALSITTGVGAVTGNDNGAINNNDGIRARNRGTDLTVTTGDGAVSGGINGIDAINYGSGALSITTGVGAVTGNNNRGIYTLNYSVGTDLTVTTGDGAVSGGWFGIDARNRG